MTKDKVMVRDTQGMENTPDKTSSKSLCNNQVRVRQSGL